MKEVFNPKIRHIMKLNPLFWLGYFLAFIYYATFGQIDNRPGTPDGDPRGVSILRVPEATKIVSPNERKQPS